MDAVIHPIFQKTLPGIYVEETESFRDTNMVKRHIHDTTEIYFMTKGERYYFIEQDSYHVKPGMAVLINPSQIHKTNVATGEGYHRFLLQIDAATTELYTKLCGNNNLFAKPYDVVEFTPEEWKDVLSTFEQLKSEMNRETPKNFAMSKLIVMQLITLFLRAQARQDTTFAMQTSPDRTVHIGMYDLVHEITLYLQQHYAEECSLNKLAEHFSISRSYLTRIFKSITGVTIKEYLTLCRIRKATSLLTSTDINITEIASRTGFGNITNFEKNFKEMTSMTPLQYRKEQRVFFEAPDLQFKADIKKHSQLRLCFLR